MSTFGTKRTFYVCRRMSVLGGKAVMQRTSLKDRVCPTTDLAPAERLQNARRKKLIAGYKSWILPAMNGCSPNQQPRKGTAHEALLCPRRLLHGPAHRGSRSRTHLRSRAG